MREIRLISIVEPCEVYTEGLRRILGRAGFRIVDTWRSVEEALLAPPHRRELAALLIDVGKRDEPFVQDVDFLRERFPGVPIALISDSLDEAIVLRAVQAQVDGFVLRTISGRVLVKSLELIVMGERVFPAPSLRFAARGEPPSEPSAPRSTLERLSIREVEVLKSLSTGSPNKVIARELGISEATVKVHVKAILRKTGTRNRTEVALLSRGTLAPMALN